MRTSLRTGCAASTKPSKGKEGGEKERRLGMRTKLINDRTEHTKLSKDRRTKLSKARDENLVTEEPIKSSHEKGEKKARQEGGGEKPCQGEEGGERRLDMRTWSWKDGAEAVKLSQGKEGREEERKD